VESKITKVLGVIILSVLALFVVHKIITHVPGKPGFYMPDPKTGQLEIFTVLDGKLEKVRVSERINDFRTQPVLVSNDGELVLLMGVGRIGKAKLEKYFGDPIKIKGHWYGKMPFRGKKYRVLWVQALVNDKEKGEEKKESEKPAQPAQKQEKTQKQAENKGGVSEAKK
jgi:hypothetical protein